MNNGQSNANNSYNFDLAKSNEVKLKRENAQMREQITQLTNQMSKQTDLLQQQAVTIENLNHNIAELTSKLSAAAPTTSVDDLLGKRRRIVQQNTPTHVVSQPNLTSSYNRNISTITDTEGTNDNNDVPMDTNSINNTNSYAQVVSNSANSKPMPIQLNKYNKHDIGQIINKLTEQIDDDQFEVFQIKSTAPVKIYAKNMSSKAKITKVLDNINVEYYTFAEKGTKR